LENQEKFVVILSLHSIILIGYRQHQIMFTVPLLKIVLVIVVDGKIISVNNYSSKDQLYKSILTGRKITNQPCCY